MSLCQLAAKAVIRCDNHRIVNGDLLSSIPAIEQILTKKSEIWGTCAQTIIFYGGTVFGKCFDKWISGEVPDFLDVLMEPIQEPHVHEFIGEFERIGLRLLMMPTDKKYQVSNSDGSININIYFHTLQYGSGYSCKETAYEPVELDEEDEREILYIKDTPNPYFFLDRY